MAGHPSPVQPGASAAGTPTPVSPPGRPHHPGLALAAGIVIPGAGQAYNGQVGKGIAILLLSLLLIPYVIGIFDAHRVAKRMALSGGRLGRGGSAWILLQGWLAVNLLLSAVVVLTLLGLFA